MVFNIFHDPFILKLFLNQYYKVILAFNLMTLRKDKNYLYQYNKLFNYLNVF